MSDCTKILSQTTIHALNRLSRLLSALLVQASTEVRTSIKLVIAYDNAIIARDISR
jgi:hypothetical protein